MGISVNVDNFARAESDRMLAGLIQAAGGAVNRWLHFRQPTPLDQQTVIRMNRDTLYSACIADISEGATLVMPDSARRYMSVMIVNQDHYINEVFHEPGAYQLTLEEFDTPYVLVAARTLVDPADPADIAAVNALQDQLQLTARSDRAFTMADYDTASLDATREALLELAKGISGFEHSFGSKDEVEPVRHLLGTAAGWGGLPEREAFYVNVSPGLPIGEYTLNVNDVPVDAFWSISMYNADGFFEPNDRNSNSVNSITAAKNDDGSITVSLGGCGDDRPNCLPLTDGWNYIVRLYQPHPEILDGTWTFPTFETS
jgi:hypothetical protein